MNLIFIQKFLKLNLGKRFLKNKKSFPSTKTIVKRFFNEITLMVNNKGRTIMCECNDGGR